MYHAPDMHQISTHNTFDDTIVVVAAVVVVVVVVVAAVYPLKLMKRSLSVFSCHKSWKGAWNFAVGDEAARSLLDLLSDVTGLLP